MARVKVTSVIQLPDKDKTVIRPGEGMIHIIPDDIMAHWFIQGKIESGEMIVVTEENQKQKVMKYNRPQVPIVKEINPVIEEKLIVPKVEVNYIEEKIPVEENPVVETKVKVVEPKIKKRK